MLQNRRPRVLVVDDENELLAGLEQRLEHSGYQTATATDGDAALALVARHRPDAVVTDLRMPGMDGLALLQRLRERDRTLPVILLSGLVDIPAAVVAMRAGAEDYLPKPVDFGALELRLVRALRRTRGLDRDDDVFGPPSPGGADAAHAGLLGTSPAMKQVHRAARRVANSRATVLVTGETGTGKGQLARAIHALSPHAEKPFMQIHCAALVDSLLESELFGHERGSFTGADRRHIGRFEQASGGTIFLDEIGELSSLMQVKLLRVLQERTFERVGSNETIRVDARIIAATNRDLAADVGAGRFREDLYHRLNVVRIEMPPLRHRAADVALLAEHFLRRFTLENRKSLDGLTSGAWARLTTHRWPGNVRALENTIERAVVLCQDSRIDVDDLALDAGLDQLGGDVRGSGSTMAEIERRAILGALESCRGSTSRAAELLQISVRTIQYRLRDYGLRRPSPRELPRPAVAERTVGGPSPVH